MHSVIHSPFGIIALRVLLFAAFCYTWPATSYGQTGTRSIGKIEVEITKQKGPKRIYATVKITAAFPGGDSVWVASLESRLTQSLPYRNGAKKGKYTVSVAFVISKDGTISDIRCLSDPGYGMGAEIVRALKKGSKWTPAPAGSLKVRVIDTNNE